MDEPRHFIHAQRSNLQIICRFFRKMSLLVVLMFLSVRAPAPGLSIMYIYAATSHNPYEKLISAVVKVESSGDNLAYNEIEEAFGAFQIRPIRVLDYNIRTGKNYKAEDCFSYELSREIFLYYALITGFHDYESIARNWNGSGKKTLDYWKKIKFYL